MTNYIKNEAGLLVPFAPAIIKRNYIEGEASHTAGMSGEYRMEVRRADGSLKHDTGWFKNLILDAGLNRLGSGGGVSGCAVGTDSTAPAATQTALVARSAWTTTRQSFTSSAAATAPYYYQVSTTWRFAIGALNGNYSEVGVGWAQDNMFSRALIVNGGGTPTPISVLADEQLDVTYRLRLYLPTTDWGGTYTIGGSSYTVLGRSYAVTTNYWATVGDPTGAALVAVQGTNYGAAYSGGIAAITATSMSGGYAGGSDISTHEAYSNSSYSRTSTIGWGLNNGNAAAFKGFTVYGTAGGTQYEFTPAIPKDNTKTLTFRLSCSWARRP